MLLLCALIAGSSSVWAGGTYNKVTATSQLVAGEEYLIVYEGSNAAACGAISTTSTKYGLSIGVTISSSTISITDQAVVSFVLGGSSGAWTFNVSSNDYLTWSSGNSLNKKTISGNTTLSNNEKWTITISEGVASIANNATSGNDTRYLKYNSSSGSERFACYTTTPNVSLYKKAASTKTASDLALTGAPIALNFDLYNNTAAQAVTYTSSSTGNVTVSGGDGYITTSVNTSTKTITVTPTAQTPDAGPVTITVNQAEDASYDAGSKTFTVAITNSDPDRAGNVNNPYTVAQARSAIDAGVGVTGVFVTGKICQIDYVNTDEGKKYATYWISADGTTSGDRLEAYQGKFTGNTDFESNDQIGLFDQVTITGNLTKYNSTYEFTAGNYIYSRTPDARSVAGLAWSDDAVEIDKDAASYVLPSLTNPHSLAVTYNITGTAGLATESVGVITVDTSIEGTATVTASFAGDENYKPASVSYTITVVDQNKKGSINNPYTVAEIIGLTPTSTSEAKAADVYVTGYIVGCCNGSSGNLITESASLLNSNLALADDPSNTSSIISVQLSSGTNRTNFNVLDHPDHIGSTKLLIKADVFKYCGIPGLKNIDEMSAVAIDVTIAGSGYSTIAKGFGLDFANATPAGLEAYVASAVSASTITLTAKDEAPASTGVILKGTQGSTYTIPVKATASAVGTNKLKTAVTATALADGSFYILKGGKFCLVTGAADEAARTVPAGKAYLLASDVPNNAPELAFDFGGETTSISDVRNKISDVKGDIFNLAGQRVAQPTKGLYIVNGKKVVIK